MQSDFSDFHMPLSFLELIIYSILVRFLYIYCAVPIVFIAFLYAWAKYRISATAVSDQEQLYKRYRDGIVWRYANTV